MVNLDILRDNREKKPWEFSQFPNTHRDVTIETGDYTLAEFCAYDEELDTYIPSYGIERKAPQDFVQSISQRRDRFKEEIKRASDWDCPLLVIVEASKTPSRYDDHFMKYTDMSQGQMVGTVDSWERHYNVSFRFAGSRVRAQQIAYDTLLCRLRSHLTSG